MGVDAIDPLSSTGATGAAPLRRALKQSEHVQGKVSQAAIDLSSVNSTLKDELFGHTLAKVELALDRSEVVETKVQEAAAE